MVGTYLFLTAMAGTRYPFLSEKVEIFCDRRIMQ